MKISYNKLPFGRSKAIALSIGGGHRKPSQSKGSAVQDGRLATNGRLATKNNNGIVPLSNLCATDGRETKWCLEKQAGFDCQSVYINSTYLNQK